MVRTARSESPGRNNEADSEEWTAHEVERPPDLLGDDSLSPGGALVAGQRRQIQDRDLDRRLGRDDLDRPAVPFGEGGPQALVTPRDLLDAPPQRVKVDRTAQPEGLTNVVGAVAR